VVYSDFKSINLNKSVATYYEKVSKENISTYIDFLEHSLNLVCLKCKQEHKIITLDITCINEEADIFAKAHRHTLETLGEHTMLELYEGE
jgi:hypothetical protein